MVVAALREGPRGLVGPRSEQAPNVAPEIRRGARRRRVNVYFNILISVLQHA
jgi:hypothetical protein